VRSRAGKGHFKFATTEDGVPSSRTSFICRLFRESRTSAARKSTTFLNADVDLIAEYQVPAGIEKKVEGLLHRFFSRAQLDGRVELNGMSIAAANEWFIVPLPVIDEAIDLIQNESIMNYEYDVETQSIRLRP
jgi:hypothetical protein